MERIFIMNYREMFESINGRTGEVQHKMDIRQFSREGNRMTVKMDDGETVVFKIHSIENNYIRCIFTEVIS